MSENICENLKKINDEISHALAKSQYKQNVKLCAVSKFHPYTDVLSAIENGQFLFGENRVQEAAEKFTVIRENIKDKNINIELHIIGQLQSNKVKKACEICDCIESVDRVSLVEEIEKQCTKLNKTMKVFLEIHTGEDSKSGFTDLQEVYALCDSFVENKYPHITVCGLMTMAPFTDNEKLIRKSFSTLRELKSELNTKYPSLPVTELSMGMSGDYKIAIEEGPSVQCKVSDT